MVSTSGHVAHEGKNYPVGEAFAGKHVGLRRAPDGQTELHFANVLLGHLRFDAEGGRFNSPAYVAPFRPLHPEKGGSRAPSLRPSP